MVTGAVLTVFTQSNMANSVTSCTPRDTDLLGIAGGRNAILARSPIRGEGQSCAHMQNWGKATGNLSDGTRTHDTHNPESYNDDCG